VVAGGPPLPSTTRVAHPYAFLAKGGHAGLPIRWAFLSLWRAGRVETIQIPHGSDLAKTTLAKNAKDGPPALGRFIMSSYGEAYNPLTRSPNRKLWI
jgi:hypothetical protein